MNPRQPHHDLLEKGRSKEDFLKEFREHLRIDKNRAYKTIQNHTRYVKELLEIMDDKHPLKVNAEDIRTLLKRYRDGNQSTYENVVKAVRVFTRFIGREDLGKQFDFPKVPRQPHPAPKDEDVKRLFYQFENKVDRAFYLTLATSGLRYSEAANLKKENLDMETGMVTPESRSVEKRTYITFVNEEALSEIRDLPTYGNGKVFGKRYKSKDYYRWQNAREKIGVKIRPKDLRVWFADKMARLGVPDRYIDAFCGRVPQSVLAKHYTDFSQERMKEVYEKAGLKVLE